MYFSFHFMTYVLNFILSMNRTNLNFVSWFGRNEEVKQFGSPYLFVKHEQRGSYSRTPSNENDGIASYSYSLSIHVANLFSFLGLCLTTTSRRSQPFTWFWDWEEELLSPLSVSCPRNTIATRSWVKQLSLTIILLFLR